MFVETVSVSSCPSLSRPLWLCVSSPSAPRVCQIKATFYLHSWVWVHILHMIKMCAQIHKCTLKYSSEMMKYEFKCNQRPENDSQIKIIISYFSSLTKTIRSPSVRREERIVRGWRSGSLHTLPLWFPVPSTLSSVALWCTWWMMVLPLLKGGWAVASSDSCPPLSGALVCFPFRMKVLVVCFVFGALVLSRYHPEQVRPRGSSTL